MLHNTVLVSIAQQSRSAICIHVSPYPLPLEPPSRPPYPTPLGHRRAPSRSPCAMLAAASHQPTILHSVVYICPCYSHFAPASPSHPMSSSPFSLSTSLFLSGFYFCLSVNDLSFIVMTSWPICLSGTLRSCPLPVFPATS